MNIFKISPTKGTMAKDDMMVLALDRVKLFGEGKYYFGGFSQGEDADYEIRILKDGSYMKRGNIETDSRYKHIIGYCLVINPKLKKAFAYRRASKDEKYDESRLHGRWSFGVGGHIEKIDSSENPIFDSVKRELGEEIQEVDGKVYDILPMGYLNDDSNDVGAVHFGVLYVALTNSTIITPVKEHEIERGGLISLGELEKIMNSEDCEVETWSKFSAPVLKRLLR